MPPGYDEDDPYEGVDLDTYPDWWRRNVELFRVHGMRPYRPPRFADGELTPEVILPLEAELGVEVRLRATDPEPEDEWEVWVDGSRAGTIERRRDGKGYTVYGMDSERFVELVSAAVDERQ